VVFGKNMNLGDKMFGSENMVLCENRDLGGKHGFW
jgi:hypothetical protein